MVTQVVSSTASYSGVHAQAPTNIENHCKPLVGIGDHDSTVDVEMYIVIYIRLES